MKLVQHIYGLQCQGAIGLPGKKKSLLASPQTYIEAQHFKKEIENMLDDLPEDANWDDLMYKIYERQSIEQGLEDSKAGRTVSPEDIKKKYHPAIRSQSMKNKTRKPQPISV